MRTRVMGLVVAAAVLSAACWNRRQELQVTSGGEVVATRVEAQTAGSLPAGADVSVRTDQAVGTTQTKVGDAFLATVWTPVVARNGDVVVPRGAQIRGKITGINSPKVATDRALVQVDFNELEFNGKLFPFAATITDVSNVVEKDRVSGQVVQRTVPANSIIGAIIIGPDLDGIVNGGLFAVNGGTVLSLGLGDVDQVIPQGTPMMLRVTRNVVLR